MRTPQPWTRQQLAEYGSAYQAVYQGRIQRLMKALYVPTGLAIYIGCPRCKAMISGGDGSG